jgi:hypothetical protein
MRAPVPFRRGTTGQMMEGPTEVMYRVGGRGTSGGKDSEISTCLPFNVLKAPFSSIFSCYSFFMYTNVQRKSELIDIVSVIIKIKESSTILVAH